MATWTIFTKDDGFVARKIVLRAGVDVMTADRINGRTLEEVQQKMPRGLFRMRRDPCDAPEIVETWR